MTLSKINYRWKDDVSMKAHTCSNTTPPSSFNSMSESWNQQKSWMKTKRNNSLMNQPLKLREFLLINRLELATAEGMLHLSGRFPCLLPNGFFKRQHFDENKKPIPKCCLIAERFHVVDTFYAQPQPDFIHKFEWKKAFVCLCPFYVFS